MSKDKKKSNMKPGNLKPGSAAKASPSKQAKPAGGKPLSKASTKPQKNEAKPAMKASAKVKNQEKVFDKKSSHSNPKMNPKLTPKLSPKLNPKTAKVVGSVTSAAKEQPKLKPKESARPLQKSEPSDAKVSAKNAPRAPGSKSPAVKTPKAAKKKSEDEFEEALISDDEVGSEELPDLSEFEDSEEEVDSLEDSLEIESGVEDKQHEDEIILTDAEGRRLCRVRDCDQAASVEGYCRYHYLLLWKKIQIRRKILIDGKLERYVEELTSRYPDKFLEMLKKDLRSEKDFLTAIAELEIDEGADGDFEDDQGYLDEVRGVTTESPITDDEEF